MEVALQYNESFQENILTFANNIHTQEGGTHLSGFKTAITRVINNYARKADMLKEKDPNLAGDDVREGLAPLSPSRFSTRSSRVRPRPSWATAKWMAS